MGTLTAHLRRTEDHGGLPFHPDCPVCRAERLSGPLPGRGRRTQAAVVAAVLAGSSSVPTVAVAQEADQVTEGIAPEGSGGDSAARPEFDPGGADEELRIDEPEAVAPDPAPVPAESDPAPVESEPVAESDVPVADEIEPAPAAALRPPPAAEKPRTLPRLEQSSAPASKMELVARIRVKPRPATSGSVVPAAAPDVAARRTQAVEPAQVTPPSGAKMTARVSGSDARHHVVAPGESLWSIARDVLGNDASPARIAREVNALWHLNSAQIATGDPDLLRVGTRLALR